MQEAKILNISENLNNKDYKNLQLTFLCKEWGMSSKVSSLQADVSLAFSSLL